MPEKVLLAVNKHYWPAITVMLTIQMKYNQQSLFSSG